MALTKERIGEISLIILLENRRNEGIPLKPKEIKRIIKNGAKKSDIPVNELAEYTKFFLEKLYQETIAELDKLITDKVED